MSTLTLIRHGQAAAFAKNSDRLTTLGEQQAQHLGDFLARRNAKFDRILCGTLQRQRHTAQIVMEALPGCPVLEENGDFNEYDATGVTTHLSDALAASNPEYAALRQAYLDNRHGEDRNKYFQRMFEPLMNAWFSGEHTLESVESATAFFSRVEAALAAIINATGSNQKVAVFTSGGVIGTAVQSVLQAPRPMALEINWRVRNSSITEFLYSRGRASLDQFNATPHLPAELVSYR